MEHEQLRRRLDPYLDGELDALAAAAVEDHLADCPACRDEADQRRAQIAARRRALPYHAAPAALRASLEAALVPVAASPTVVAGPPSWRRWALPASSWLALAASLALYVATPSADEMVVREVIADHLRSELGDHLTDVASSDQHNVKPWFAGKLDASPPAPDLAAEGFALAGGRLDLVGGKRAAAVVYRHRLHVINLLVVPAAAGGGGGGDTAPRALTRQGINLVHWNAGGLEFWAVSDLNPQELMTFAELVRTRG